MMLALIPGTEYERCREGLQDVDLGEPWSLLHGTEGFFRLVLGDVCDEWPTVCRPVRASTPTNRPPASCTTHSVRSSAGRRSRSRRSRPYRRSRGRFAGSSAASSGRRATHPRSSCATSTSMRRQCACGQTRTRAQSRTRAKTRARTGWRSSFGRSWLGAPGRSMAEQVWAGTSRSATPTQRRRSLRSRTSPSVSSLASSW
jgi:hypothetical protein